VAGRKHPGVETPGYCQVVPLGRKGLGCAKFAGTTKKERALFVRRAHLLKDSGFQF
jgi:hypothetical protein